MRQQQRGGTVIGFIVGVMVGLGAALAVAVYVTKVPVPFTNKNQPRSANQDAAEAAKNKDWDPNAPLYGKNPPPRAAPPVIGDVAPPPEPAPMPQSGPASTPKPSASKASAAARASAAKPAASATKPEGKPATSSDPIGDLAKAKAGAGVADPFSYFVQAGAFRTPEDAEAQRAKLALMGLEGRVTEREQSGRTVYRVRVGPFDNKDAADRVKEKLDGSGMESALVRVQR